MVEDAKWQDEEPVTADYVTFTIKQSWIWKLFTRMRTRRRTGVNGLDDHTVAFTLQRTRTLHFLIMTMAVASEEPSGGRVICRLLISSATRGRTYPQD